MQLFTNYLVAPGDGTYCLTLLLYIFANSEFGIFLSCDAMLAWYMPSRIAQLASPFSAMRVATWLFPNDFGRTCYLT